jgi:hypothetical protein
MSENAQRFRFDLRPQHWMQAGARHHIGFRAEDEADTILDIDQLDETEARVVGIEKQIDITVRPGFAPGDRAEQVQSSDPDPMEIGFMGAQSLDDVVSIHGSLRERFIFVLCANWQFKTFPRPSQPQGPRTQEDIPARIRVAVPGAMRRGGFFCPAGLGM